MAQLVDLALEVLHNIFQNVEPVDLSSLSKTCRHFNKLIQSDELLWKHHYLGQFGSPLQDEALSWRDRLTGLINVEKILESEDEDVKAESFDEVLTHAAKVDYRTSPETTQIARFLARFAEPSNINAFLCKSSLSARAWPGTWIAAPTESLRQLSAQLHVLGGMNLESPWPSPHELTCPHIPDASGNVHPQPVRHLHPYARSRVYDLRRYTLANLWGPFMDDGSQRIDWEKVQAIMIDIAYNHRMVKQGIILRPWDEPFQGIATGSFESHPLSGPLEQPRNPGLDALDPYGVTGTWMRIVCFLDYHDLHEFNFEGEEIPDDQERDPILTREAFRLIRLQLRVSRIEKPGEEDGQELPVVHFEGDSRSLYMAWDPNANSKIRGTVRQTASGAIRWTSFSIFHGEERWRSEGVQIGGLRSARGILGNWFDKDYDEHGPAGPTAFWKISDDIVAEKQVPVPQMPEIFLAG
ncbi:uncharacterized protein Z518_01956 [Rhinocladiella mackenziei CBS 650.93]|uniref:F-box domain-containing protein n=1 Tax=Rhinocladiella mackenziei CBS 650.93 TaxID=1442369 RepID=A0A0D2H9Y6_9EURO|nr:uncharacterized protein Z518_01956 [Rhinocladiella mackenziei CBS 650.93]KIX07303.1 hypothetical protein Z518_01956 [Rhinocladiella mackenziei CBS 650.93]